MIKELVEALVLIQKAVTLQRKLMAPDDIKRAEEIQKMYKDGRAV
jgi:hypothetical protein